MKFLLAIFTSIFAAGCSVVGQIDVQTAPYQLVESDDSKAIEVRNYESMVLVSTSMESDGRNSAFRKLFNYITGDNEVASEIAMTAPVFMDERTNQREGDAEQGRNIAMTAPVLMNESQGGSLMSFVMPKDFTLENTPKPTDPEVFLSELSAYKVATIRFSGTLSESNVEKHTRILTDWMALKGYQAIAEPIQAAYNGPLTLPMFRTNEVLIEIE